MTEPILRADDIVKSFPTGGRRRLKALDGVSLHLQSGQTLGVVGESGCGKSTLGRSLMTLEKPDSGTIRYEGRDPFTMGANEFGTWRRKVQMVFQDPYSSLNPRMSASALISEPWKSNRDLYPTKEAKNRRTEELLELVGLRSSDGRRSPREFSGGQRQRIGIARALALDPEVLILDEPVSALDLSVQAQVLNVLEQIQRTMGVAYVFISHDLSVVRHVADRVAVMYLGRVIEQGDAEQLFNDPRHPYTKALISASPTLTNPGAGLGDRERIVLRGEVPSPVNPPSGCRFRTRCWKAQDLCAVEAPEVSVESDGRTYECHFPLDHLAPRPSGCRH